MSRRSSNLNVMIKAAEKAARSLLRDFGEVEQLQVSRKGPADFVSAADRRAEEIIRDELTYARPDFGLLMEESGVHDGKDTENRWIVDPLDGTTNFLHGLPHWAISIALETNGEIVAGLIYDAVKDDMFIAEKNQGASVGRKRLRVSGRTDPMESVIASGMIKPGKKQEQLFAEHRAVTEFSPNIRRYGAAALDLAYVAAGRYEAFWEYDLNLWDIAAGYLIVKESGGFMADIHDDRKNPLETGNIIAGNEKLFTDLKKVLRQQL